SHALPRPGARGRRLGAMSARRFPMVRIDALGRISVLPRDRWEWPAAIRAPLSSNAGSVAWRVRGRWPRLRIAAVSADGSKNVYALPRGATLMSLAVLDIGACALVRIGRDRELVCVDEHARLRWTRRLPEDVTGELV